MWLFLKEKDRLVGLCILSVQHIQSTQAKLQVLSTLVFLKGRGKLVALHI
jgi:hypothetical protein